MPTIKDVARQTRVSPAAVSAVRLLVDRLSRPPDEPVKRLVLSPTLIVRESCAPLRH